MKYIMLLFMVCVLLVPSVSALEYYYCINDSYLGLAESIQTDDTWIHFLEPEPCDLGCVNSTFEGRAFCRTPPKPINQDMYILFEVVAIFMLLFSMVRKKEQDRAEYTYQHGIISGISMVLFFALALLTVEVIVVYVNLMFGIIAFIWTVFLYLMSIYPDKVGKKGAL